MYKTEPLDPEKPFSPRIGMTERYSIEYMAKSAGISIEEFKARVDEELKIKDDLIKKYLDKGYTQEQAETTALRIMYTPGFSGQTFRD